MSGTTKFRLIHLAAGIALFVIFTVTGRYMRLDFPDKSDIDQSLRILMRSRHIYILFVSLIHLALAAYISLEKDPVRRVLQIAGSLLLTLSGTFLVRAWYTESYLLHSYSDISREGIYLALAGVGVHLLARIPVCLAPSDKTLTGRN